MYKSTCLIIIIYLLQLLLFNIPLYAVIIANFVNFHSQMASSLNALGVPHTRVTLQSVYEVASVTLTFEITLNSTIPFQEAVSIGELLDSLSIEFGNTAEVTVFEGSRGVQGVIPSG